MLGSVMQQIMSGLRASDLKTQRLIAQHALERLAAQDRLAAAAAQNQVEEEARSLVIATRAARLCALLERVQQIDACPAASLKRKLTTSDSDAADE